MQAWGGDEDLPPDEDMIAPVARPVAASGSRPNARPPNAQPLQGRTQTPQQPLFQKRNAVQQSATQSSSSMTSDDPFELLRKLLYTPPVSIEQLGSKMQVSLAAASPTVPKAAFITK
jgi:hypothetical protein